MTTPKTILVSVLTTLVTLTVLNLPGWFLFLSLFWLIPGFWAGTITYRSLYSGDFFLVGLCTIGGPLMIGPALSIPKGVTIAKGDISKVRKFLNIPSLSFRSPITLKKDNEPDSAQPNNRL